jgi:hypothetical protein
VIWTRVRQVANADSPAGAGSLRARRCRFARAERASRRSPGPRLVRTRRVARAGGELVPAFRERSQCFRRPPASGQHPVGPAAGGRDPRALSPPRPGKATDEPRCQLREVGVRSPSRRLGHALGHEVEETASQVRLGRLPLRSQTPRFAGTSWARDSDGRHHASGRCVRTLEGVPPATRESRNQAGFRA